MTTQKGKTMFKKTIIAGLVAGAFTPVLVSAQQAPASPHTLTGNVGVYSQYIFRGMSQTNWAGSWKCRPNSSPNRSS